MFGACAGRTLVNELADAAIFVILSGCCVLQPLLKYQKGSGNGESIVGKRQNQISIG
jgi:hypothetical protein